MRATNPVPDALYCSSSSFSQKCVGGVDALMVTSSPDLLFLDERADADDVGASDFPDSGVDPYAPIQPF